MKYALAVGGLILAIFVLLILILTYKPNNSSQSTNTPVPRLADLANTNAVVNFTNDGPIVADELHRTLHMSVSRSARTIDVTQGYVHTTLKSNTLFNTEQAYQAFLAALDRAGFTLEHKTKLDTEAGLCPTSNRYVFELVDTPPTSAFKPFRRWSTACDTNASFGGQSSVIIGLFQAQFPDYANFMASIPGASVVQ